MVALASTRLPLTMVLMLTVLTLASLMRLLDGVKNPSDARFFSTLANSTDGSTLSDAGDELGSAVTSVLAGELDKVVVCAAFSTSRLATISSIRPRNSSLLVGSWVMKFLIHSSSIPL